MKKNLTEIVFIIDRSGSMAGLEGDTIGGFNSMIAKQKKEEGEALISTILFDTEITVLHDRVDVQKVEPLNEKTYSVRGCTALLDAIGGAIHHIGNVHKYIRDEDVPEHTMFVITTDGMENASHRYTSERVKQMIQHEKEKYGWEFLFLGANIDAVETAESFGIGRDRAVNYNHDSFGTQLNYEVVGDAISNMRAKGCMDANWSAPIARDFAMRGEHETPVTPAPKKDRKSKFSKLFRS
ncbi:MAG: vWA domain-containing protein [Eubacteriales bacterium]|nr:vWA domain-containing protein [Eubacteriales bacterium]